MAKSNLTKEQVKRLNALNISTKSDDAARKGIIDLLAQNDVDGMDDEDMDTLLDLAESLIPDGAAAAPADDATDADDAEAKELAQEAEAEESADDAEEAESEEESEGDEFDGMDRNGLKKYIKENGLEVKVFKSDSDDDIRAKIRAAVAAPAAEEEKPAAPAKKEKKAPVAKKAAEKAEKKPTAKRGVKLDPQNNEEDMKTLKDALTKLFPEDEFRYDAVKSAGVTIKHKGQNSNRALVLIENCSLQADGSIKCNLYFLTLAKNLEVLDNADIAYEKCWSGAPFIKGTTLAEAVETIDAVKEHLTAQVKKIDKRLGENRAKMEEGLAKKSAAKKDADENAPAEKPAAKAPAKKTVKKK